MATPTGLQLPRDELLRAYRMMCEIREFEDRVHDEFATGAIPGFVHLYAGEEASAAGFMMHLHEKDYIASTHRGHGHCIAKGCDIKAMMKEIYGRRGGLCGGKGGSMHIADLDKGMMGANGIVGGGPPLICGAALTAKTLKTGGVAIAFVGDGGSNQGTTLESYNLATVWQLPAIFVIEDNRYAESTAAAWSVGGSQVQRAEAFGMPGRKVDGHDFFAVYEAAGEAIERAQRRWPQLGACRNLPLLRPLRGRCHHVPQRGRGRGDQAYARLLGPVPLARHRGGRARGGTTRRGRTGGEDFGGSSRCRVGCGETAG